MFFRRRTQLQDFVEELRHKRAAEETRANAQTVAQLVLDQVARRLQGQSADADAKDLKILGLLGANVALIAVLIATHNALGHLWWICLVFLGLAVVLHLGALYPRQLDTGPDWKYVYEKYGGGQALDVTRYMLSELLDAIERNGASAGKWHGKDLLFKIGFLVMLLGFVGAAITGYLR